MAIALLVLVSAANLRAEGWNGIDPLRSTRADVEKKLGKCSITYGLTGCLYKQADRNILIEYSVGTACGKTETVWNVPGGTVLGITIYQTDGGILFKYLPFDLKGFSEEEDPELRGIIYFTKPGNGLTLATESGFVKSFYYGPSDEERKRFKCAKYKK